MTSWASCGKGSAPSRSSSARTWAPRASFVSSLPKRDIPAIFADALTEIAGNLSRLVAEVSEQPPERTDLGPDQLLRWHQSLFGRTRLDLVGRFRTAADPPIDLGVPVLDPKGG